MTLSQGGKGHRILARLELGPAFGSELIKLAGKSGTQRDRRKAWRALSAILRQGLVCIWADQYHLTPGGHDALTALELGHSPSFEEARPNVRVFAREAA